MSLKDKIKNDLIVALKAKEELRSSTLRLILASVQNKEIEKRGKKMEEGSKDNGENKSEAGVLSDEELTKILIHEAKKRKDAASQYAEGGRQELAHKEEEELKIIKEYLPEEISEDKIRSMVRDVIKSGTAGFGPIMQKVIKEAGGMVDGKVVSKIVKEELGS